MAIASLLSFSRLALPSTLTIKPGLGNTNFRIAEKTGLVSKEPELVSVSKGKIRQVN